MMVATKPKVHGLKKVVSASEMARMERKAYTEGASDRDFMITAGQGIAEVIEAYVKEHHLEWVATLLCGKGNNGGDAYVAGRHLLEMGYHLRALHLAPLDASSPLCQEMRKAYQEAGGEVIDCTGEEEMVLLDRGVIVDGILGTGFRGEMEGLFAHATEVANRSPLPVVAVDIPSGINGDTGEAGALAMEASSTVTLGLPKRGCFVGEGWNHLGGLHLVDFGLSLQFVEEGQADFWMVTKAAVARLLPPIKRNRHKYQAGYVAGIAGSDAMPGAALLASEAALRSGAGMMRLFHHFSASPHHLGAAHELLHESFTDAATLIGRFDKVSALFIGPGLGRVSGLEELITKIDIPCVIDADALTLAASLPLPKATILTPHRGEMTRILGLSPEEAGGELAWLERCGQFAKEKGVVLILKGGPTFVFAPQDEKPYVIPFGDPGMATAGCGDVLTGILASLLAQGLAPREAALLGAALHGMAGERCAKRLTSYSLVASDITRELPYIFREVTSRKRSSR